MKKFNSYHQFQVLIAISIFTAITFTATSVLKIYFDLPLSSPLMYLSSPEIALFFFILAIILSYIKEKYIVIKVWRETHNNIQCPFTEDTFIRERRKRREINKFKFYNFCFNLLIFISFSLSLYSSAIKNEASWQYYCALMAAALFVRFLPVLRISILKDEYKKCNFNQLPKYIYEL